MQHTLELRRTHQVYNECVAQMKEFGVDPAPEWVKDCEQIRCDAETARFSICMVGMCAKKITKTYNETARSAEVKKEMAALRLVIGDRQESKYVPKALLERCVAMALKKK